MSKTPEYETQTINGVEHKVVWEVLDESGRVVEETIGEEWAFGVIRDAGEFGNWGVNDRLEELL